MRSYRVAATALLFACGPVLLSAQSFSFSAGGIYAALNGSDFDGINAGVGGDLLLRYHAASGLSIGGGVQYTSHGIDGIDPNFGVTGFFADARYAFERKLSASITPYVGARVVLASYNVSQSGTSVHFGDAKVNGATQSGTKSSGSSLALRAGVVFGFGKK